MSSSIVFLNEKNFTIKTNQERKSFLCNDIQGVSLVLFFSKDCKYCGNAIEIVKTLSHNIGYCSFAMCDLSKNPRLISTSQKLTGNPITEVPYILLYFNGIPIAKYNDKQRSAEGLTRFIQVYTKKLVDMGRFNPESARSIGGGGGMTSSKKQVSEYGVIPYNVVCDDEDCCYIVMET